MQVGRLSRLLWMLFLALSSAASLLGQSSQQNLPDAPQPQQTVPPAGPPAPTESSSHDSEPAPAAQPRVDKTAQPASANSASGPADRPATTQPVRNAASPDTERLYTISKTVNFIELPVTVKDRSGRMVPGLLPKDFTVYENGARQK